MACAWAAVRCGWAFVFVVGRSRRDWEEGIVPVQSRMTRRRWYRRRGSLGPPLLLSHVRSHRRRPSGVSVPLPLSPRSAPSGPRRKDPGFLITQCFSGYVGVPWWVLMNWRCSPHSVPGVVDVCFKSAARVKAMAGLSVADDDDTLGHHSPPSRRLR